MKKGDRRKYADRREYLKRAVSQRRKVLRRKAIDLKGGRCELCGYDRCEEALEFHHLDTATKAFGISARGHARSWERVKEELEKCLLVCANCHRELHMGIAAYPRNRI